MKYPSIFIYNSKELKLSPDLFENISFNGKYLAYNKGIKSNLFFEDNKKWTVVAHVNYSCKNILSGCKGNFEDLFNDPNSFLCDLHWGFILSFDKSAGRIKIVNDIYGIYPLYYCIRGNDYILSNDFDGIIENQETININIKGLYDYFLFNYTLKSRTLINEISQVEGGSILEILDNEIKINKIANISSLIFSDNSFSEDIEMSICLSEHINNDIDPELPIKLPLTGGFDTKVILSILLSKRLKFSSYTFGLEASDDNIAARSIADGFKFPHSYLRLPIDFIENIKPQIDDFLRFFPNAPMFDTLIYYQLVKESISPSNIITGKMGGELIVGPVLISELITTRSSAQLTMCNDFDKLLVDLKYNVKEIGFLNTNKFGVQLKQYAEPLKDYMKKSNGPKYSNLVNFLLNETYAKFFGVVFNNLFAKHNLINPFVDINFLKKLLNSEYSFTSKHPFSKAPISHFVSRQLYPKLIKKIYPPVLEAKMDRGYNLKDFLHWYNFPKPFYNYFKRHFFPKKQITLSESPIDYMGSLKNLVIDSLGNSKLIDWDVFEKKSIRSAIENLKNGKASDFQVKKLIQLLTIHLIVERYSKKLTYKGN